MTEAVPSAADRHAGASADPIVAKAPAGSRNKHWLMRGLVIAAALAAWELVARSGLISDQALPGAAESLARAAHLLVTGETWSAIGQTVSGWGIGLLVATAIAIPVGLGLGLSPFTYRSSRFMIDFIRTIPALGLIPLASLLFGSSRAAELVVVIPACLWPLLLQTAYGVRDVDPLTLETARSFRLGRWQTLRHVILPGSAAFIATGLRLSAVFGMLLAISIELLALVPGLGKLLAIAQRNGESVDVYALTLIAGLLGVAVVLVFARIERWLIRWHPSVRGGQ